MTQLDIYPLPQSERDEDAGPWPTYPKTYRLSAAHEEARDLETAPAADADAGLFVASTLRFTGDADGQVRALHLVECDAERHPVPGTGRALPADLVLLALGFRGPDREDGLIDQLGLTLDRRGLIARDADFATSARVYAAGGTARGQSLIVWAIAEGRAVAAAGRPPSDRRDAASGTDRAVRPAHDGVASSGIPRLSERWCSGSRRPRPAPPPSVVASPDGSPPWPRPVETSTPTWRTCRWARAAARRRGWSPPVSSGPP